MSSDSESKTIAKLWAGIIVAAVLSVLLGCALGFVSQALLPVKTFATLPPIDPKKPDVDPLPKVYWLKQGTGKGVGKPMEKEKAVKAGVATWMTDKEINSWLSRTFTGEEPKEDIDAKLGTPFVRIGGQGRGEEREDVLTVTMPFKLKIATLPVSEVPLQFVARPVYDGGETSWSFEEVRVGHAKVPRGFVTGTVTNAINEVVKSQEETKSLWAKLGAYRRIMIRDNKLLLESPVKVAEAPASAAK